jgi:hypothetical protein
MSACWPTRTWAACAEPTLMRSLPTSLWSPGRSITRRSGFSRVKLSALAMLPSAWRCTSEPLPASRASMPVSRVAGCVFAAASPGASPSVASAIAQGSISSSSSAAKPVPGLPGIGCTRITRPSLDGVTSYSAAMLRETSTRVIPSSPSPEREDRVTSSTRPSYTASGSPTPSVRTSGRSTTTRSGSSSAKAVKTVSSSPRRVTVVASPSRSTLTSAIESCVGESDFVAVEAAHAAIPIAIRPAQASPASLRTCPVLDPSIDLTPPQSDGYASRYPWWSLHPGSPRTSP